MLSSCAAFIPTLRIATLGCDVALIACVWIDFARTPRPDRLRIRRRLPARAGLSQDFTRTLRIDVTEVPAAGGLELELYEEFSPTFEVRARTWLSAMRIRGSRAARTGSPTRARNVTPNSAPGDGATVDRSRTRSARDIAADGRVAPVLDDPTGGPDRVRLPSTGPIDVRRIYRSRRRGVATLGDMRLRLTGRLGLVERQARVRGSQTIAIEPALVGLKRTLRLAASERWRDLGVRHTRRRGGLSEFESLREHVSGDDLRVVDWKAFAKRGRPIVRQYQEERGQELILVFDCGRRMAATTAEGEGAAGRESRAPIDGWTKLDHALDCGLQIAAVALQRGDRVGALAFGDRPLAWLPPARGAAQLERLRDALFALTPSTDESNLERALRELALRHRRRAMVVILSDVADPLSIERQRAALATGSRRHVILFAGLDDPALRAAAEGRTSADAALRATALALTEERRRGLMRLGGVGVRVIDTLPAEGAGPVLAAWLDARRTL